MEIERDIVVRVDRMVDYALPLELQQDVKCKVNFKFNGYEHNKNFRAAQLLDVEGKPVFVNNIGTDISRKICLGRAQQKLERKSVDDIEYIVETVKDTMSSAACWGYLDHNSEITMHYRKSVMEEANKLLWTTDLHQPTRPEELIANQLASLQGQMADMHQPAQDPFTRAGGFHEPQRDINEGVTIGGVLFGVSTIILSISSMATGNVNFLYVAGISGIFSLISIILAE